MNEIYEQIKKNAMVRIFFGVSLVIFGLLVHLIPFVPGSWIIVIGLEILGIRLLVQNKLFEKLKTLKFFHRVQKT